MSSTDARPYATLAHLYDFVMRHVDYVEWADHVESIFREFSRGTTPANILEVACGTGTLALELSKRGYRVHGIDLSAEMVEMAREKAANTNGKPSPTFSVSDMTNLPEGDSEALICLYDSVNYCLTHEDLSLAIQSFHRSLRPWGLCIFDVTTEFNSLRYFRDNRYQEQGEGWFYTRHSHFDKVSRIQINDFLIRRGDGPGPGSVRECHRQRVYPTTEILNLVEEDLWHILGVFDDFTLHPANEKSERIHIVLQARG
jgi:ubiquinone/menaquinone biosynthesis C-methylase UbiE